jgi:flavin-dependent dehydrogenase
VAASARAVVAELGVLLAVEAAGFRPAPSVLTCWETALPSEQHGLFSARGSGWLVERTRFDRLLADLASERGARVRLNSRVGGLVRQGGGWCLHLAGGEVVSAGFIVLATGRRWGLIRCLGAQLQSGDRLVGGLRLLADRDEGYPGLAVEASANGWWYTLPLAGGRRVLAWMTDADLADPRDDTAWSRAFAATELIRQCAAGSDAPLYAGVHPAASTRLDPASGPGWLAVGDTAAAVDPLSAQGVAKALRSGLFAAYAAADALAGRDDAILRFTRLAARQAVAYDAARSLVYQRARRWPDSPFWQRRQA